MRKFLLPFLILPFLSACSDEAGYHHGEDVVEAMYDTYKGKWYSDFYIKQKVTYYQQDTVAHTEIWDEIISLPGKVRSIIGNPEDGNCEIYTNGNSYRFNQGKPIDTLPGNHSLYTLAFDVYVQDPETTLNQLSEEGFDMDVVSDTLIENHEVLIVGSVPGKEDVPQFWVDKEKKILVRISLRSNTGSLYSVDLMEYIPFEEGWMATYLIYSRKGRILMEEHFIDFGLLKTIPEHSFETDSLVIVE